MRSALAVLALALTASLHAADLDKYREWDESPQGYFMTQDERAQWKTIKTDDEAAKFVADFLARRDAKFTTEVATRAQNADKYLTIGKLKGSKTLRGKVVILFGPPAAMDVNQRKGRTSYNSGPSSAAVTDLGTGASASSGGSRGDAGDTQTFGDGKSGMAFQDFTFTFTAKSTPALGGDYSITIEADSGTGKDRVRDKKKAAELEEKFDAVARASIKK